MCNIYMLRKSSIFGDNMSVLVTEICYVIVISCCDLPLPSELPNTDAKLFSVTNALFVITGLVVGLTAPKARRKINGIERSKSIKSFVKGQ